MNATILQKYKAVNAAVEAVMFKIQDVETADGEELSVSSELRIAPELEERMVLTDRYVIAGGLCADSDVQNPLEDQDGAGNLYHRGRRAWGSEKSKFYAALGLDSDGNRLLGDEAVSDELAKSVCDAIRKNRSLMTTLSNLLRGQGKKGTWDEVCATVADAIYREGAEYAADYFADKFLEVAWMGDVSEAWQEKLSPLVDLVSDAEIEAAWQRAMDKGTLGERYAVKVDIYEHSGISYSVSGEGMQCRWDTTRAGAVWVPNELALENIQSRAQTLFDTEGGDLEELTQRVARDYCRGVLEEYTDWCNGNCYGVVLYAIDRQTGERVPDLDFEAWGFIGSQYAEENLDEAIMELVKQLNQPN